MPRAVPARPNLPTPTEPLEQAPTAAEVPWIDPYDVSHRRDWLLLAIVLGATIAAFLPALQAGFIWNDDRVTFANPALRSARTLAFAWLHPRSSEVYRPVADTFLFPQQALWRAWNPSGYHTVSLGLHLINTWLVWLVLRRLRLGSAIPLAGAMLFAVHPLAAQPVSWIAQQPILLATTFSLLSILAFLRLTEIDPPPPEFEGAWNLSHRKWLMLLATLVPLLCALLSDAPAACGLAIAMPALLWWRGSRDIQQSRTTILAPLILSAIVTTFCVYISWSQSPADVHPLRRLLTTGGATGFHIGKLILPWPLAITYRGWDSPALWAQAILTVALMIAVALIVMSRRRGVIVVTIAYLALLLPPIILQPNPQSGWVADHQQYLARLPPLVLFAIIILRFIRRPDEEGRRRFRRPVAFAAIGVLLMAITFTASETYANSIAVWIQALKHHPDSTLAHTQLGEVLLATENLDKAADQFRKLIDRDPSNVEARLHLADVLDRQKKSAEAAAELKRAAELNPNDASIHRRLGAAASRAGDDNTAITHYEAALKSDPRDDMSLNNLATIHARRGEIDRAIIELRRAIELNPHSTKSHINLSNLLFAQGKLDDAAAHLKRAAEIDPNDFDAYMTSGAMLMNFKDFHNAALMFRRAVSLRRESPEAFNALGVSLAAQGQFDEAIYNFGRAVDLNPRFENAQKNLDTARAQRDRRPIATTGPSPAATRQGVSP